MVEHGVAGVRFLTYGVFEPFVNVTNVVTTRVGGRSKPPYDSLNLGLHVGDDPDSVLENRAIVAQILGFEPEALTVAEQVHGSSVAVIRGSARGSGSVIEEDAVSAADAMITNEPDVPLAILVADCVAISLYDPAKKAIGIAHAGWKGTLGRVTEKTLQAMSEEFDTSPGDVVAGLSPAIGVCHYQVGPDVADAFSETFGDDAAEFVTEGSDGVSRVDLCEANARELVRAGVSEENIEFARRCTACTPDLFFSYRLEKPRTGRFAGIIVLHYTGRRNY